MAAKLTKPLNGCQTDVHSATIAAVATVPEVPLQRVRERELVRATRALFDERGMQQAPIEEIAQAAGIARGLIYRHFSSKEELFVLTVTDYLDDLAVELREATDAIEDPALRLERCAGSFADFCGRYPAFLDAALALMQRPARELYESVSESVWLRLGRGIADCVDQITQALRNGVEAGEFEIDDPDFVANLLWTQCLGAMHLARIRVGIRRTETGEPDLFSVDPERVIRACVDAAMAAVAPARRHPA
jgi:AcrR family transcriptional regulator